MKSAILYTMVLALAACHRVVAVAPPADVPAPDPPARVARVSYVQGAVSLRPASAGEWTQATLNRPLTTGDAVWTDQGARAELHFGSAALRLHSNTEVTLLEVGSNAIQVRVAAGTVAVHVRDLDENEEVEIATPQAATSILRAGHYRIDVAPDGASTRVIARNGSAELSASGFSFVLRAQQQAQIPAAGEKYAVSPEPVRDGFDEFCAAREAREEKALAAKHVSHGVIGYEDLDEHGVWRQYPSWGPVWIPRVPPGWVPYRHGHWVWIEPWGWTWIDDAPWGFAPFHYGRWIAIESRWCWIPGPFHRRPVWAPALVVFAGGDGFHFHFRVGVGLGVAWFPLGPREVWFPPYRASRRYVTQVNITHTTVVNETHIHQTNIYRQHYVNRNVTNAITGMPRDPFLRGEAADRHAVNVPPGDVRIGGTAPPFSPTRESLGRRTAQPSPRPPEAIERRSTVVHRTPPPPPVAFEQRRPELDRSAGRVPPSESARGQQPTVRREPEYRTVPRREPRATKPPEVRPPAEQRQDRQWEQRTRQDEERRRQTIEKERQREPGARGGQSGSRGDRSSSRDRKSDRK